jgi:hypothetical protein
MPVVGAAGQQANQKVQPAPAAAPTGATQGTAASASLLANPNYQDQIAGYLSGQYSGSEAQYGLTASLGSAQLGLDPSALGVSSAELENSTGYDLANALLGYQGIGLQSQALASQAGTAAAQQGISNAEYAVSATQYPEQMAEAKQQFQTAQQGQQDQGAATGTTNTQGQKTAEANLASNYGWQQADIYRNQQLAALGQQSSEVGFGGTEEQLANAQQQLKLSAEGQGLTAQQATSQLGFGLQSLGVSAEPEQYLAAIANAQGEGASQLSALGSQAALIGGLGPNFLGG